MSTITANTMNIQRVLKLPLYTTTQRNALSPVGGTLIFNTTDREVQVYVGTEWRNF